jgi:hypothetical protein
MVVVSFLQITAQTKPYTNALNCFVSNRLWFSRYMRTTTITFDKNPSDTVMSETLMTCVRHRSTIILKNNILSVNSFNE